MNLRNQILANITQQNNKCILVDKFGSLSGSDLENELMDFEQSNAISSIIGNKILIHPKQNDRYLIFLIMLLLEVDNELFLAEPRSTHREIEIIKSAYPIESIITIDENGTLEIQRLKANTSDVERDVSKLYFFSSGTTGIPKLFAYTENTFIQSVLTWNNFLGINAQDVTLCPLTITHYHGCLVSFGALLAGGTLILSSSDTLNIVELEVLLLTHLPTIMTGVPYLYQKIYENIATGFQGFKNMRYAICGSAPLMIGLSIDFYEKYRIYLNQGYGLSEIGGVSLDKHPELGLGTVGTIVPEIDYRIINEVGEDTDMGELILKSEYMTTEYYLQPQLSSERYINGWLYTGDIVQLDKYKRLIIKGRKSTFINIQGYKVFPIEIENCIFSFGNISSVLVKTEEINDKTTIIAYLETNKKIDIIQLKQYCLQNLANYKVPGEFYIVNTLEKTSIGKINIHLNTTIIHQNEKNDH